ncbi:glycoside hydrolase family 68 protein [Novosphingobium bradum]|uniref:Glycoside hydrolase family 68 protein n=1 Tax=Novosphingobium bradum TaxID=1737444 RepID=A0ABV7IRN8_9SPHN
MKLEVGNHGPGRAANPPGATTTAWRPTPLAGQVPADRFPTIPADQARPLLPGLDLWDCWPLAHEDGHTAAVMLGGESRSLWFFLSAPRFPDPADRHAHARIRLLSRGAGGWRDHGPALPDGWCPGSREWAGSAVLGADGHTVTLYLTAAGRRGEARPTFEQRLFEGGAKLGPDGLAAWREPEELVRADGHHYLPVTAREEGAPGTLKAFRDPFWFRDPATGGEHLVFTASAAWSADPHNGVVGLATRTARGWTLEAPLVEAVGVNNELERPQLVVRGGRYYLFWSTQAHTFSPRAPGYPTGLYGMVADRLRGPWRPLNGHGLVAANPADEPAQAYSWCVTGEDEAWSFVDYWGMAGRSLADHPDCRRGQFGGTPAPVLRLRYAGDRVRLER